LTLLQNVSTFLAGFRLVWALYWFGITAKVAMSQPALAIVPIVISCLTAVTVGYYLGYTIALQTEQNPIGRLI
jgi:hypothetical protein